MCVLHFLAKELQLSFAKYSYSPTLFWSDFFTFWNLVDIIPLFFVTFCSIAVDIHLRLRALDGESNDSSIPFYLRVAVATTTPFLWLRVLGHLKMWNKQLATFVLCSVEIMKDIKWVSYVCSCDIALYISLADDSSLLIIPHAFSPNVVHVGTCNRHVILCSNVCKSDL